MDKIKSDYHAHNRRSTIDGNSLETFSSERTHLSSYLVINKKKDCNNKNNKQVVIITSNSIMDL